MSSGTLASGANDLSLLSAGNVNVTQGTVSGANIGITAGSLVVQPGVAATSSSLVNATGNLTVNANTVKVRGSDASAGLTAKLQAAGAVTINAGSVSIEGGDANNASAAIDPVGITITTTGNVTLTGGSGADAYALIFASAGNLVIDAPTGTVALIPGTGLNANAALVASLGTAQLLSAGCTPLLANPISGPSVLASGVFGSGGAVIGIVPVAAAATAAPELITLPGLLNQAIVALIEMGDEEGAQSILVSLGGEGDKKKDEQSAYSCR